MQTLTDYNKALLTLADTDSILTAVTIVDGDFPPDGQPDFPRNITIAVTTATITAGFVTVSGFDAAGNGVSEVLDLSGGTTLTGTANFATVSSIVVSGLVGEDPADTFIVGTGINIQLTQGKTVLVAVTCPVNTTTGSIQIIDGTSGTTTNVAQLKSGIVSGVYKYKASIGSGLRIILNNGEPILITYYV